MLFWILAQKLIHHCLIDFRFASLSSIGTTTLPLLVPVVTARQLPSPPPTPTLMSFYFHFQIITLSTIHPLFRLFIPNPFPPPQASGEADAGFRVSARRMISGRKLSTLTEDSSIFDFLQRDAELEEDAGDVETQLTTAFRQLLTV